MKRKLKITITKIQRTLIRIYSNVAEQSEENQLPSIPKALLVGNLEKRIENQAIKTKRRKNQ